MLEIPRLVVENFIIKVFNYLNCKVNVVNRPATLTINWSATRSSRYNGVYCIGLTTLPANVIIFPMGSLMSNKYQADVFIELMMSIIHELLHVDQKLDYINTDNVEYMEDACYTEQHRYFLTHVDELSKISGFNINENALFHNYARILNAGNSKYPYQRNNYINHLCNLCKLYPEDRELLTTEFINTDKNIYVTVDGYCIPIRIKGVSQDISALNAFFGQRMCYYNCDASYRYYIYGNEELFTIEISSLKHGIEMCRIIQEGDQNNDNKL